MAEALGPIDSAWLVGYRCRTCGRIEERPTYDEGMLPTVRSERDRRLQAHVASHGGSVDCEPFDLSPRPADQRSS